MSGWRVPLHIVPGIPAGTDRKTIRIVVCAIDNTSDGAKHAGSVSGRRPTNLPRGPGYSKVLSYDSSNPESGSDGAENSPYNGCCYHMR